MRRRSGWPRKRTPNMSQISRSAQLAMPQMWLTVSISAPSPSMSPTRALSRKRCPRCSEYKCITTSKRGSRSGKSTAVMSLSMSMSAAGDSRRKRATFCHDPGSTTTVSSPCCAWVSTTASGNSFLRSSTSALAICGFLSRTLTEKQDRTKSASAGLRAAQLHEPEPLVGDGIEPGLDHLRAPIAGLDLVLQEHEAVEHAFGARRTARDVHVARDDLVDARDGGVVVVEAADRRAGPESEHPLRFGHLLVNALQDRRLALDDGAHHPEQLALARREARRLRTEARKIVARAAHRHELHAAASGHEGVHEQRVLLRPGQQILKPGRGKPLPLPGGNHLRRRRRRQRSHSSAPFFQQ